MSFSDFWEFCKSKLLELNCEIFNSTEILQFSKFIDEKY